MTGNDSNNPYQVPATDTLTRPGAGEFADTPRTVPAGNGLEWIQQGWNLFKLAPGPMILMVLIYLVLNMVMGMLPLVNMVSPIVDMIILGGVFIAIHRLDRDGELKIEDLFSAFSTHLNPLLLLGLLVAGAGIIIFGAIMVLGLGAVLGGSSPSSGSLVFFVVLLAVGIAVFFTLYFTVLYAILLVVLGNQSLGNALNNAFSAFLKNWAPFLVNGIIGLVITLIAMIPMGLGLLVSAPLMFASMYVSYKDIFAAE